jgi:hypothetical protein
VVEGGGERVGGDVGGGRVSWILGRGRFCFGVVALGGFGAAGFGTAFGCGLGLGWG